jgi:hypothetical protein
MKKSYSEADMKEAYFTAIKSTGEGWNGEYAGRNHPNIEKTFNEGFEKSKGTNPPFVEIIILSSGFSATNSPKIFSDLRFR